MRTITLAGLFALVWTAHHAVAEFTYVAQTRAVNCNASAGPNTDSGVSGAPGFGVFDWSDTAYASYGSECVTSGSASVAHHSELNANDLRVRLTGSMSGGGTCFSQSMGSYGHFVEVTFTISQYTALRLTGTVRLFDCCMSAHHALSITVGAPGGPPTYAYSYNSPGTVATNLDLAFHDLLSLSPGTYTFRLTLSGSAGFTPGSGNHFIDLKLAPGSATCTPEWQAVPGVSAYGVVRAMTVWDPSGPGNDPPPQLVLAGSRVWVNGYESDADSTVLALAVSPNNTLFAAGGFDYLGGSPVRGLAKYLGTGHWERVGGGVMGGSVVALLVMPNGDLVVAGSFVFAGSVPVNRIARWDGTTWSTLGAGVNATVQALALTASGDLVVGGDFTIAGGQPANRVARWDGTNWEAMGAGFQQTVRALLVKPNGEVYAGGTFVQEGGSHVAKWNESAWTPVGGAINGPVYALTLFDDDTLVAGGHFTSVEGSPTFSIARTNGSHWFPLSPGVNGPVYALLSRSAGALDAGGSFATRGPATLQNFARWDAIPGCEWCDAIDFNGDKDWPDAQDLADFLFVFSGGPCSTTTCGDIDFNNDGSFPDTRDIDSLLSVFAGGPCL